MFVALSIQHEMPMWPALLYNIFPNYLINGTIFDKNFVNIKCVF